MMHTGNSVRPGTAPTIKTDSNNYDADNIMSRTQSSRLLRSPINSGMSFGSLRSNSRPSTSSGALPGSGVTSLQLSGLIESVERLSTAHSDIQHMHAKIETMSRSGTLADPTKTSNMLQNPEMHREQGKKDILQNRLDEQSLAIRLLSDQLQAILSSVGMQHGASAGGNFFGGASLNGDGSVVSQLRDDESLFTAQGKVGSPSTYTDLRSWSSPQNRRKKIETRSRRVKTVGLPNKQQMTLPKHVAETQYQPSLAAIISPPSNPVANFSMDAADTVTTLFKATTPRALTRGSPKKGSTGGTVTSRPRASSHDVASMHTRSNLTYQGALRDDERLDDWINSYDSELSEDNFSSVAVYAELRMREAMEKTRGIPRPNGYRTAVAMDMLYKTLGIFGRYNALMKLIADELACSIYLSMKDMDESAPAPTRASIDMAIPYFDVHAQMTAEVQGLRDELIKTQHVGGAMGLQQMSKRNNGLVKRIQARQKLVVRNVAFCAWQGYYYDILDRRRQLAQRKARRMISKWFDYFRSQKKDGGESGGGAGQLRAKFMKLEQEIEEARSEQEALVIEKKQLYQLLSVASEDSATAGKLTTLIQKGGGGFANLDEDQLQSMGSSEGGLAAGMHHMKTVATQTVSTSGEPSPPRRGPSGIWQRAFNASKRRGAIVVGAGGNVLGADDDGDGDSGAGGAVAVVEAAEAAVAEEVLVERRKDWRRSSGSPRKMEARR